MGLITRYFLGLKYFFKIWFDGAFADQVKALDGGSLPEPEPVAPRRVSEEGQRGMVRLLSVMQREGRLVDFLQEDVTSFDDAQVGAAARAVHAGCRKVLQEFVTLEPVMKESEGDRVAVEAGFDASAIELTGAVQGEPPFRGALAHHGWRAATIQVPELPPSMDAMVVQKAQVEV